MTDDARVYHAHKVMQEFGFTDAARAAVARYPMAGSIAEAVGKTERAAEAGAHWTSWATDADMARLQAVRDGNEIVQAARADLARRTK